MKSKKVLFAVLVVFVILIILVFFSQDFLHGYREGRNAMQGYI